jgi:hypothetical protein
MRFRRHELSLSAIAVIVAGALVMVAAIPAGFFLQRIWLREKRKSRDTGKSRHVIEVESGSTVLVGLRRQERTTDR